MAEVRWEENGAERSSVFKVGRGFEGKFFEIRVGGFREFGRHRRGRVQSFVWYRRRNRSDSGHGVLL